MDEDLNNEIEKYQKLLSKVEACDNEQEIDSIFADLSKMENDEDEEEEQIDDENDDIPFKSINYSNPNLFDHTNHHRNNDHSENSHSSHSHNNNHSHSNSHNSNNTNNNNNYKNKNKNISINTNINSNSNSNKKKGHSNKYNNPASSTASPWEDFHTASTSCPTSAVHGKSSNAKKSGPKDKGGLQRNNSIGERGRSSPSKLKDLGRSYSFDGRVRNKKSSSSGTHHDGSSSTNPSHDPLNTPTRSKKKRHSHLGSK